MEVVNKGTLRRIDHERSEDVEAMMIFKGIYGVGPYLALGLLNIT